GLTSLLLAVNRLRSWGIDHRGMQVLVAIGIASLVAFFVIEQRVAEPLLAPSMLRHRVVSAAMGTSLCVNAAFNGLDVLTPFAAKALWGWDTTAIAWLNGVRAFGFASGAAGARRFLGARPARQVVRAGHLAVAVSCALVGYGAHATSAPWFV